MDRRSKKILTALVVLCIVGGGAYVAFAAMGPSATTTEARPKAGAVLAKADLMVRAVDPANPLLNGRVFVLDHGRLQRQSGNLACERVYYAGDAASAWASPAQESITRQLSSTQRCGPCTRFR